MGEINNQNMLRVGTILHGTYKIESYLASGGFGNTYLAKNIEFDETYAIKEFFVKGVCQRDGDSTTISVSNAENTNSFEQQREKFKKEARRLRSLSNPHIVKVYDLFEENGTAYYVMDYVDGENLSARLKRTNAPLSESEVRNYLNQILDGLEAIHNEGMFHLDIKPANIMVDSHDVVRLIDFGASKQQSTVGGATMSTGISYTNGYAPSEQMAQSYDKFGPWTDFYALGATVYKLLTNQDPPSVSDLSEDETEDKHLALPMPNVSEEMKKLVVWMMQVNRLKRPKDVGEIKCLQVKGNIVNIRRNSTSSNFSDISDNGNENTILFDNKSVNQFENIKQKTCQVKVDNSANYRKKTCLVVAFGAVLTVICGMFFFFYANGNTTSSVNTNMEFANTKVINVAGVTVSGLDPTKEHGWVDHALVEFYGKKYKYWGYVQIKDGKLYPYNGDGAFAGEVSECDMIIMEKKGKYSGQVTCFEGKLYAHGTGTIDFDEGGYCSAAFSLGKIENADVNYYYPNGDWFSGTVVNNKFVKGSLKVKKTGKIFFGSFTPEGKPLKGKWLDV